MTDILDLKDAGNSNLRLVGGKAASLGNLLKAGVNVPDGFVLTTELLDRGYAGVESVSDSVFQKMSELSSERVAVRSSAVGEDSGSSSWAGQLDTELNVIRPNLMDAIKTCIKSKISVRLAAYAKSLDIQIEDLKLALVIQVMVDSDISGVAFSTNPINNDHDQIVIEAIHGLGELMVHGDVTPDNFIINKSTREIVEFVQNSQSEKLVYRSMMTEKIPIIISKTLSDRQLSELIDQIELIEKYYNSPQDIEWAFAGGKLFILQSRPITTLSKQI